MLFIIVLLAYTSITTSSELDRRWIPRDQKCKVDEEWVGRFCDRGGMSDGSWFDLCKAPFNPTSPYNWPWIVGSTPQQTLKNGLADLFHISRMFYEPGMMNTRRIPTTGGSFVSAWMGQCPEHYLCFNVFDKQRDPHLFCIWDESHGAGGGYSTVRPWLKPSDSSSWGYEHFRFDLHGYKFDNLDGTPLSRSGFGPSGTQRLIAPSIDLTTDVQDATVSALLLDDKGKPLTNVGIISASLEDSDELLCQSQPAYELVCDPTAVRRLSSKQKVAFTFDLDVEAIANAGLERLTLAYAVTPLPGLAGKS